MKLGTLDFLPLEDNPELAAKPVQNCVKNLRLQEVLATSIDASLADTAAFCEQYRIGLDISANCIVVEAKRADRVWYAACIILATTRADINSTVRKALEARKISFAPMDKAVSLTGMEYGGITPIGLPEDWPIFIDTNVIAANQVIIGSGLRASKLLVPSKLLQSLPNATVLPITKGERPE